MKTVCLDFDGVLNTYDGWKGEDYLFDPRPGAKEFIERLWDTGYTVVIHSTRPAAKIRQWLIDHKIISSASMMQITDVKPPAVAYIDDRGIRFDGSFDLAFEKLKLFKAHWEK